MTKEALTDKRLRAIKVGPGERLDITDSWCPCLQARVSPGGITFTVTTRRGGKQRRRTLGKYPALTLADARRLARQAATSEEPEPRLLPAPPAPSTALTFSQMVDRYVELYLRPREVRSWKNIQSDLRHPHLAHLRERLAGSITKVEFIAAIDRIVADGKPQAAVNILRRLKMLFNWAVNRDLVPVNPCERIPAPAKTNERDRILANGEIKAVIDATFKLPPPFGAMIRLMVLTGQRRSEVAKMRWSDISGDLWTIPRDTVKKDRAHSVPLSPTAVANIRSLPFFTADGYVFTTSGGERPSSNFAKVKKELDRISGVTDWRLHDIRRTVRSKLAELGVPREVACKVINHAEGKIDRIYNRHAYMAEKREALERWEKHLTELLARTDP